MSGLPTAHNEAGKGLGLKKTCSLRQLLYTAFPELLCRERSGGPPQAASLLTETYVHQDTQTQACSGALCIPQVQRTVSSPQVHTSVDLTTERGQAVHTEELSTLGMHMLQPLYVYAPPSCTEMLGKCSTLCARGSLHTCTHCLEQALVLCAHAASIRVSRDKVQLQHWEAMEQERKWEADQGNVGKWDGKDGKTRGEPDAQALKAQPFRQEVGPIPSAP